MKCEACDGWYYAPGWVPDGEEPPEEWANI